MLVVKTVVFGCYYPYQLLHRFGHGTEAEKINNVYAASVFQLKPCFCFLGVLNATNVKANFMVKSS